MGCGVGWNKACVEGASVGPSLGAAVEGTCVGIEEGANDGTSLGGCRLGSKVGRELASGYVLPQVNWIEFKYVPADPFIVLMY